MDVENEASVLNDEYSLPDSITYTLAGLHFIIVVTSLTGNIAVVALLMWKKRHKTNANFYLTAIAVSDILLVLWCEPFTVLSNLIFFHWMFGQFMCSAVNFFQTFCVIQRSFTLVASSLDRYYAIKLPLKEPKSRAVVIGIITAICIIALLLPVPVAIFSQIVLHENGSMEVACFEVWPNDTYRRGFSIFLLLITYFVPLLVLTITFRQIVLILQEKPPGEELDQLLKRRRDMKRRTIKVFLLAFCAYAVCWLPIHVITIIGDIHPEIYNDKAVHIIWLFAQCLAVSNSAISPIIVLVREKNLRSQLMDRLGSAKYSHRESELLRQNSFTIRLNKMRRTSTQLSFVPVTSSETKQQRKRSSSASTSGRRESDQARQGPPELRRSSTKETCV